MGNKFNEIDKKNHAYYFFDDMINIKNLDPNEIKINEKPYKNIYWICNSEKTQLRKNYYFKSLYLTINKILKKVIEINI